MPVPNSLKKTKRTTPPRKGTWPQSPMGEKRHFSGTAWKAESS